MYPYILTFGAEHHMYTRITYTHNIYIHANVYFDFWREHYSKSPCGVRGIHLRRCDHPQSEHALQNRKQP